MRYKGDIMIEKKEIYVGTTDRKNEEIELRKNFGWTYVEDTHHGRTHALHIVLQRDPMMKKYKELDSLEKQYDNCKKQLKVYHKIVEEPEDLILLVALFLLLIFPLVLYCLYKSKQKERIAINNAGLNLKMKSIIEEAQKLR